MFSEIHDCHVVSIHFVSLLHHFADSKVLISGNCNVLGSFLCYSISSKSLESTKKKKKCPRNCTL